MKETEEEILKRIKANPKEIILCRQYHESMLQSSIPSEEEIENAAYSNTENNLQCKSFSNGVKWAIELLTKGKV